MVVDYQTINYHIDKVIDKVNFILDKWGKTHLISTNFTKKSLEYFNAIKELRTQKITKRDEQSCKKIL